MALHAQQPAPLPTAEPSAGPLLEARDVNYAPGGHPVLRGISLALQPGEVTVIIGPNGAGKSTLLSILAGDAAPGSGSVELAGRPLRSWKVSDAARQRAVMTQDTSISFPFPVQEVVQMGRNPWRKWRFVNSAGCWRIRPWRSACSAESTRTAHARPRHA